MSQIVWAVSVETNTLPPVTPPVPVTFAIYAGAPGRDGTGGTSAIISSSTPVQSLTANYLLRVSPDGTHVDQVDPNTIGGVTSVNTKTGAVTLGYADVGADQAGAASSAISAHVGQPDPHTQYLQKTAAASTYATTSYVTSAIAGITFPVTSVAGRAGSISLTAADVGTGTFTGSYTVVSSATNSVALTAKLVGGQTADMIQLRDASNTLLTKFDNHGGLSIYSTSGFYPLTVYQFGGAVGVQIDPSGGLSAVTISCSSGFRLTAFGSYVGVLSYTRFEFLSNGIDTYVAAAANSLRLHGEASQSADLFQMLLPSSTSTRRAVYGLLPGWVNNSDATRKAQLVEEVYDTAARTARRVYTDGTRAYTAFTVHTTAPADADLQASEWSVYTDGTGLFAKFKNAASTVYTINLAGGSYTLPTASGSTLGGVKVGSGLSIDGAGVLSATGGGGSANLYDAKANGILTTNSAATNATNMQTLVNAVSLTGGTIWLSEPVPMNPFTLKKNVHIQGTNTTAFKGSAPLSGASPTPGATPSGAAFLITNTSTAFITYESNTSVDGVIFYYPSQNYTTTNPASLVTYPAVAVKSSGVVSSVSFTRCTLIGCTTGFTAIGTNTSTDYVFDLVFDLIYGYPLGGTLVDVRYCLDIPRITRCHLNPGAGVLTVGSRGGTTYQIAHDPAIIDNTITNGSAAFNIDNTDEFMMSQCFAFGSSTGLKASNSYGSVTNCNFDMVTTGIWATPNASHKVLTITGLSCIPSAGPTPSARNILKFDGSGGTVFVSGLSGFLGTNGAAPSSGSPSANAPWLVSGSGAQTLRVSAWSVNSISGSWSNAGGQITNGSATVETVLPSSSISPPPPPPPPPPVTPLNDTFTDSAVALDSHTSDSSHTWFGVATSVGGMALTGSGTVYGQEPPLAQTIYASSFTPSSADYTVSVTYKVFNFAGDFGAFGRFSGTTPTTFSGYGFRFSAGGGGIQLYKAIAGSYTQLGSTVTATPVDGDVLSLTMASNVLTVKKNGSTVLTVTDSSSPILTAGGVAIWASDGGGGTTAGLHATQIQTS